MAKAATGIIITLLVVLVLGLSYLYAHGTVANVSFEVVGHERVVEKSGDSVSSKYVVFTDDETFENTDSLWHLKFNSSDLRGQMPAGARCDARVYGVRVGVLSMYRNLIEVDCNV